jgi:glycoside/pentoside/hexuronide:cation symporter, GPH family
MPPVPLPRHIRVGYGLGSFCAGTFNTIPGLLLLYYMTNALDVPAATAGVAAFLPKLWDLVISPFVGRLSDRAGSRRPWLLAGAVTLPPAFVLMFAGAPLRGASAAVVVGLCFLLAATAFALFEVPYKTMPAEMTDDYHERSTLLTWRMVFLGLAVLLSGGLAPALVNVRGGDPSLFGYRLMALVMSAVLLAAMIATFVGTARAPRIVRTEPEHTTVRRQLAAARENRPFIVLLWLSATQMLGVGTMLAGAPYLATYILEDSGAITTMFLALIGPITVTMPAWLRLSRKYDKRGGMLAAGLLYLLGGLGLAFTPILGNLYAHLCVIVIGTGYGGLQMLQFSMLADTIVYDERRSGKRRGGMFTGLWTAAETATAALGALFLGWLLAWTGFVSSEPDKPVAQPESATNAILIGTTVAPSLLMAIALIITLRYPLRAAHLAAPQSHNPAPNPTNNHLESHPDSRTQA